LISLVAGIANLSGFWREELHVGRYGLLERIGIFFYDALFYVAKTLVPVRLSPYYELRQNVGEHLPALVVGTAGFVIITWAVVHFRKLAPALGVCWITYLLILAPISGLLLSGQQIAADRYSYLSCLPWAILAGAFLATLNRRRLWILSAGALALLAVLTRRQTEVWRNDISLWTHAERIAPGCLVETNLATALMVEGDREDALTHYGHADRYCATDPALHVNLGTLFEERGDFASATREYQRAIEMAPSNVQARLNLAVVHLKLGNAMEGIRELKSLTANHPEFAEAHFNLGVAYMSLGKKEEGRRHLDKALRLRPDLAARLPRPT
jgi:Flp pilus assembly protein TadD